MAASSFSILASAPRAGRLATCSGRAALAAALIFAGSGLRAEDLGGDDLRAIVENVTWVAEDGWGFWSWNADNTACVRLYSAEGDCSDSGAWSIEDNALCYEFEWWGEPYGLRKNCFVVRALGEGRYESLPKGSPIDTAVFAFSLAG